MSLVQVTWAHITVQLALLSILTLSQDSGPLDLRKKRDTNLFHFVSINQEL